MAAKVYVPAALGVWAMVNLPSAPVVTWVVILEPSGWVTTIVTATFPRGLVPSSLVAVRTPVAWIVVPISTDWEDIVTDMDEVPLAGSGTGSGSGSGSGAGMASTLVRPPLLPTPLQFFSITEVSMK